MYRCGKCNQTFEKLQDNLVRCPKCAYKVLYKVREPVVKEIKAR